MLVDQRFGRHRLIADKTHECNAKRDKHLGVPNKLAIDFELAGVRIATAGTNRRRNSGAQTRVWCTPTSIPKVANLACPSQTKSGAASASRRRSRANRHCQIAVLPPCGCGLRRAWQENATRQAEKDKRNQGDRSVNKSSPNHTHLLAGKRCHLRMESKTIISMTGGGLESQQCANADFAFDASTRYENGAFART